MDDKPFDPIVEPLFPLLFSIRFFDDDWIEIEQLGKHNQTLPMLTKLMADWRASREWAFKHADYERRGWAKAVGSCIEVTYGS